MSKKLKKCPGEQSDGYHTFNELYEHRHALFIFAGSRMPVGSAWMSWRHHDGTVMDGWFIAGITHRGISITYHLPDSWWKHAESAGFIIEHKGRPWDGHTSHDVVGRLMAMSNH